MKAHIEKPIFFGNTKIYLSEEVGSDFFAFELDAENPPFIKRTKLEDYAVCPAFIELPVKFADDFLKALLDALSDKNIKTENENLLMGKFTATEKHLEDMRKIVFKDYKKWNTRKSIFNF